MLRIMRILADLIDFLLISMIITLIIGLITGRSTYIRINLLSINMFQNSTNMSYPAWIIFFLVLILKDGTNYSLGKRIMGLRIYDSSNEETPKFYILTLRNLATLFLLPLHLPLTLIFGKSVGDLTFNTKVS